MTFDVKSVLAIDVGSSCVKLGWFPSPGDCASKPSTGPSSGDLAIAAPLVPAPAETLRLVHTESSDGDWLAELDGWLDGLPLPAEAACLVGSVHRTAADQLCERLVQRRLHPRRLTAADLPLTVRMAEPERVGIDRLLGALAANRLRSPGVPAIAVDMGTAITVDLIAADGAFEGGAILAGPTLSLLALHGGTASLPRLDATILDEPPSAIGKSTTQAMAAGAYWGTLGAVRELIQRISDDLNAKPELFVTGGAAGPFAPRLAGGNLLPARHVPHLVLAGIRIAADELALA